MRHPFPLQCEVVQTLQEHLVSLNRPRGSQARAGEIKDLSIALGVAIDKLLLMRAEDMVPPLDDSGEWIGNWALANNINRDVAHP